MIDIHVHIIPNVDDGAEDMQDALLMAELAVESGVHTIAATPHCNLPIGFDNYWNPELAEHFQRLQTEIHKRGLPLEIWTGMEIYATEQVPELIREKKVIPINDSGRYLVEFDFYMRSDNIRRLLEKICDTGAIPIVAHPERYICVQRRPQIVMDWLDMGCQLQINRGSFFGSFGRGSFGAADELLRNSCVAYIASDAHSPYRRTTYMRDVEEFLSEEYSRKLAEKLLRENPNRFLRPCLP